MYCKNCGSQVSNNEKFCKNCGCSLETGASGVEMPDKKKTGMKPIVGVALLITAVVCVTAVILNVFIARIDQNDSEITGMDSAGEVSRAKEDLAGTGASGTKFDSADSNESKSTYSQQDYDKAVDMAEMFSGEWYVKKYYDGESWNTYELGKKMLIVAYNFLNDGSYTTGGYKYLSESDRVNHIMTFTYVPVETHTYHGKDIEYSCPTIIITSDSIDMSGMDGPIFDISDFRYENINGDDFLINDSCNFALTYDGTYIEYCEPDTYGYYQGYYAFDPFDSLVNVTVTH